MATALCGRTRFQDMTLFWISCFLEPDGNRRQSPLWCTALSVAHSDDWARFARTLVEIRANRADGEEEGPMELAS
ncbi:unnamed protein product [Menidia menidia]|uniref:(Atlantic silverside) hypothetical protein n=1 Tax=Menidia menidia TaxID=238744 RepID=A0A8S4ALE5_9TELE|nr:unnamed protein product [Menidia menidia]